MKRILVALLMCLPAVVVLPGFAHAGSHARAKRVFPVTITDDHGTRVHIARKPVRIVSLDPRDTETLFSLGLEHRVVGDGGKADEGATGIVNAAGKPRDFRYPSEWPSRWGRDYPIKSLALPHVEGGCCGVDFNLETIESLQPDLILAPYSQTEAPLYQKMRDLGLRLIVLDPANISGIMRDIRLVGKATGTQKQASVVVGTMKRQIKSVQVKIAHTHSRPRVYYELDASNPTQPITAGPGTYIDEGIKIAGGKNIADGVTSCSGTLCYPSFSLESLVQLNPQIIIYSIYEKIYSGVTRASIKSRGGWDTIAAVRRGKIYAFNDDLLSRGGPRSSIGVEVLARLFHPGLFTKRRT